MKSPKMIATIRPAKGSVEKIEVQRARRDIHLVLYDADDPMWPRAIAILSADECRAFARALTRRRP